MAGTEKLMEVGGKLGLSGDALYKFISEQQALEREERAIERQNQKEREQLQREQEREQLQRERELSEAEERERIRQQELEMARLELDKAKYSVKTETEPIGSKPKQIKLLEFRESRDEMDAFLFRFELQMKANGWSNDAAFQALTALLTGKALDVLHSLSTEELNYEGLKKNLLKRFNCTAEGYQSKFREALPQVDECIDTFVSRLEKVCNRWLELSKVDNGNYEQLKTLILKEQIYTSLNTDVVTFLKERQPTTLSEIKELVNKYKSAYPNKVLGKDVFQANVAIQRGWSIKDTQSETPDRSRNRWKDDDGNDRRNRSFSRGNKNFDNYSHQDKQVFKRQNFGDKTDRRHNQHGNNGNYRDHYSQDRERYPGRRKFSNFAQTTPDNLCSPKALSLVKAYVNGSPASCLFDSGANCIGVKKHLLKPTDYTGKSESVTLFGGKQQRFDIVMVNIMSPYYTGNAIALALDDCIADVIVGNVNGSSNIERNIDYNDHDSDSHEQSRYKDYNIANVVTIATSSKGTPTTDTVVETSHQNIDCVNDIPYDSLTTDTAVETSGQNIDSILYSSHDQVGQCIAQTDGDEFSRSCLFSQLDYRNFKIEQNSDRSLDTVRVKAYSDDMFTIKNGLLYRITNKVNGIDQLVVPKTLRNTILKLCHDSPHKGLAATRRFISRRFTWKGMYSDINKYVRSCDVCRRRVFKDSRLPVLASVTSYEPFVSPYGSQVAITRKRDKALRRGSEFDRLKR